MFEQYYPSEPIGIQLYTRLVITCCHLSQSEANCIPDWWLHAVIWANQKPIVYQIGDYMLSSEPIRSQLYTRLVITCCHLSQSEANCIPDWWLHAVIWANQKPIVYQIGDYMLSSEPIRSQLYTRLVITCCRLSQSEANCIPDWWLHAVVWANQKPIVYQIGDYMLSSEPIRSQLYTRLVITCCRLSQSEANCIPDWWLHAVVWANQKPIVYQIGDYMLSSEPIRSQLYTRLVITCCHLSQSEANCIPDWWLHAVIWANQKPIVYQIGDYMLSSEPIRSQLYTRLVITCCRLSQSEANCIPDWWLHAVIWANQKPIVYQIGDYMLSSEPIRSQLYTRLVITCCHLSQSEANCIPDWWLHAVIWANQKPIVYQIGDYMLSSEPIRSQLYTRLVITCCRLSQSEANCIPDWWLHAVVWANQKPIVYQIGDYMLSSEPIRSQLYTRLVITCCHLSQSEANCIPDWWLHAVIWANQKPIVYQIGDYMLSSEPIRSQLYTRLVITCCRLSQSEANCILDWWLHAVVWANQKPIVYQIGDYMLSSEPIRSQLYTRLVITCCRLSQSEANCIPDWWLHAVIWANQKPIVYQIGDYMLSSEPIRSQLYTRLVITCCHLSQSEANCIPDWWLHAVIWANQKPIVYQIGDYMLSSEPIRSQLYTRLVITCCRLSQSEANCIPDWWLHAVVWANQKPIVYQIGDYMLSSEPIRSQLYTRLVITCCRLSQSEANCIPDWWLHAVIWANQKPIVYQIGDYMLSSEPIRSQLYTRLVITCCHLSQSEANCIPDWWLHAVIWANQKPIVYQIGDYILSSEPIRSQLYTRLVITYCHLSQSEANCIPDWWLHTVVWANQKPIVYQIGDYILWSEPIRSQLYTRLVITYCHLSQSEANCIPDWWLHTVIWANQKPIVYQIGDYILWSEPIRSQLYTRLVITYCRLSQSEANCIPDWWLHAVIWANQKPIVYQIGDYILWSEPIRSQLYTRLVITYCHLSQSEANCIPDWWLHTVIWANQKPIVYQIGDYILSSEPIRSQLYTRLVITYCGLSQSEANCIPDWWLHTVIWANQKPIVYQIGDYMLSSEPIRSQLYTRLVITYCGLSQSEANCIPDWWLHTVIWANQKPIVYQIGDYILSSEPIRSQLYTRLVITYCHLSQSEANCIPDWWLHTVVWANQKPIVYQIGDYMLSSEPIRSQLYTRLVITYCGLSQSEANCIPDWWLHTVIWANQKPIVYQIGDYILSSEPIRSQLYTRLVITCCHLSQSEANCIPDWWLHTVIWANQKPIVYQIGDYILSSEPIRSQLYTRLVITCCHLSQSEANCIPDWWLHAVIWANQKPIVYQIGDYMLSSEPIRSQLYTRLVITCCHLSQSEANCIPDWWLHAVIWANQKPIVYQIGDYMLSSEPIRSQLYTRLVITCCHLSQSEANCIPDWWLHAVIWANQKPIVYQIGDYMLSSEPIRSQLYTRLVITCCHLSQSEANCIPDWWLHTVIWANQKPIVYQIGDYMLSSEPIRSQLYTRLVITCCHLSQSEANCIPDWWLHAVIWANQKPIVYQIGDYMLSSEPIRSQLYTRLVITCCHLSQSEANCIPDWWLHTVIWANQKPIVYQIGDYMLSSEPIRSQLYTRLVITCCHLSQSEANCIPDWWLHAVIWANQKPIVYQIGDYMLSSEPIRSQLYTRLVITCCHLSQSEANCIPDWWLHAVIWANQKPIVYQIGDYILSSEPIRSQLYTRLVITCCHLSQSEANCIPDWWLHAVIWANQKPIVYQIGDYMLSSEPIRSQLYTRLVITCCHLSQSEANCIPDWWLHTVIWANQKPIVYQIGDYMLSSEPIRSQLYTRLVITCCHLSQSEANCIPDWWLHAVIWANQKPIVYQIGDYMLSSEPIRLVITCCGYLV